MDWIRILAGCMVFLYGIVIGSFLNVCIYRIPKGEDLIRMNSHCMSCGYRLKWYDLFPIVSYLCLGGRCRKCKAKISCQYPIIEACNGGLYVLIFTVHGYRIESVIYCLAASALLVLSVIDFRTYEIPFGINGFLFLLACIHLGMNRTEWSLYAIGFFAVSAFLYFLYLCSRGRAIGGGDIKLMAAAGLLLGWKKIIAAFLLGCILGSIIHLLRMKIAGAEHVLAMGPYLSAGILISMLWGDQLIGIYLGLLNL